MSSLKYPSPAPCPSTLPLPRPPARCLYIYLPCGSPKWFLIENSSGGRKGPKGVEMAMGTVSADAMGAMGALMD